MLYHSFHIKAVHFLPFETFLFHNADSEITEPTQEARLLLLRAHQPPVHQAEQRRLARPDKVPPIETTDDQCRLNVRSPHCLLKMTNGNVTLRVGFGYAILLQ